MKLRFYPPRYDERPMQTKQPYSNHAATAKRSRFGPWLWLVLVGFLWLQFAGVVHKHSHANAHTDAHLNGSVLEQLLPEHSQQNKSDCQLLDLQCGGLALSQALPVLALPMVGVQVAHSRIFLFSVQTNLSYQARAPPQTLI